MLSNCPQQLPRLLRIVSIRARGEVNDRGYSGESVRKSYSCTQIGNHTAGAGVEAEPTHVSSRLHEQDRQCGYRRYRGCRLRR
jgi:hypothetical protein